MARNEIISQDFIDLAVNEIEATYGHQVRVNRKTLHKFGRHKNAGTTEEVVVYLGIDPVHSATNSVTHFSSTNAADTQTLRVEGFTISGNDLTFVAQDITLSGQTKTALATPLSRVIRIANVASATATLGDVYVYEDGAITGGIPNDLGTVGGVMAVGDQSTLFAGASVASNSYLVICNWYAYLNKKTTASADMRFKTQRVGSNFYRSLSVASINNNTPLEKNLLPFLIIPPNTDIDITAVASTTGVDISAGFSGFFVDIVS